MTLYETGLSTDVDQEERNYVVLVDISTQKRSDFGEMGSTCYRSTMTAILSASVHTMIMMTSAK